MFIVTFLKSKFVAGILSFIQMLKMLTSSLKTPPPRPVKPERKKSRGRSVDKARVLFPYVAENEDELSIDEGDIINVLDRELEDSGWWKGELNGKVGVFPDNFVDIIPAEDNKPKKPPPPSINKPAAPDPEPSRPVQRPPAPNHDTKPRDEKRTAPPMLPTKKPAMPPPPLSKKPMSTKNADYITQTDDHKAQSQKEGPVNFDSVPTVETLPHLNSTRPNPPQHRRLPTAHRERKVKKEDTQPPSEANEQPEEAEKEEPPPPAPAPLPPIPEFPDSPRVRDTRRAHRRAIQKGELQKAVAAPEETPNHIGEEKAEVRPVRAVRPAPPLPVNHPPPSPILHQDFPDSAVNGDVMQVVTELRKEMEELRASTVPRSQYESLQSEVRHLKETVTKLEKLSAVLMNDIDEGAKERRGMQVEIDRVKKLSMLPSGS